jgi:hypothetical protein
MHCSILIPDFFSSESVAPANRLAAAETLIARGRRKQQASTPPEAWLFERFGAKRQRDWPVAPYTLLADGGTPEAYFWMRADPVHLSVGRDSLELEGAGLDVSRSEAEALAGALTRHFGETLAFHPLHPERWYVRLPATPEVDTTPPSAAHRTAIEQKLPSGADAMRFRALMNEVQMLLHEHPVNIEREDRGAASINSVWFWGGGTLAAPGSRPFSMVLAEDPLARGLARSAGTPERRLPGDAEAMLSELPAEGRTLVVLDAVEHDALERDWFGPLLAALGEGRIGMLSLFLAGKDSLLEVETVRSDLRYFWRTRKPLQSYLE